MWIVKVALDRPYTFIILALLILLLSPVIIVRTPVDIFPNINIPVIAISWTYSGLNPEEFEGRVTLPYEKVLTTLVDNIQHIESTTYNGLNVVKVYLQPGASLDTANAQVTAASQFILAILRDFKPLSADQMQTFRDRGKQFNDGRYELYKSTLKYDSDLSRSQHGYPSAAELPL